MLRRELCGYFSLALERRCSKKTPVDRRQTLDAETARMQHVFDEGEICSKKSKRTIEHFSFYMKLFPIDDVFLSNFRKTIVQEKPCRAPKNPPSITNGCSSPQAGIENKLSTKSRLVKVKEKPILVVEKRDHGSQV